NRFYFILKRFYAVHFLNAPQPNLRHLPRVDIFPVKSNVTSQELKSCTRRTFSCRFKTRGRRLHTGYTITK
ncbi:hypothetical protein QUG54_29430, partial [Klebsiella michiganensis]|uniref:hypothetical protein n=1 Tax=Klebsiella michiganensis TaxID=1134687 RepID=UPI0025A304F6